MKNSINIFAPLRNPTGYAEVVRNLVKRLYFMGWKVNFSEFQHWSGIVTKLSDYDEKMFKLMEANQYPSEKLLSFCLPEQCAYAEDKVNILYTMYEASRDLPQLWVDSSEKIDHIIVPTRHNYRLWNLAIKTGWGKIHHVPLGVDSEEVHRAGIISIFDNEVDFDITYAYKNRILVFQEFISRKNLEGVLRAFYGGCIINRERFEDTCLVLKVNSNSGSRMNKFVELVRNVREDMESKSGIKFPRNVFVYTKYVEDENLYSFINSFTHYFSMSLGEGWDLTAIKAAALGKQLIVPASTSYLEYLDESKAHLIPCTEDKFDIKEQTLSRIYSRSLWTIPIVEEAARKIADLDRLPVLDATSVKDEYSWEKSAQALSVTLEEISQDSGWRNTCLTYKSGVVINPCTSFINSEKTYLMNCKSLGQHCGIGEFSKTLHSFFAKAKAKMVTIAGDLQTAVLKAEEFRPSIFHIQNEYQFFHIQRLRMAVRAMRERGIKLFLTQHTYNSSPFDYNDFFIRNFDRIIVHNKKIVDAYYNDFGGREFYDDGDDKVVYIPMPVERRSEIETSKEMEKAMTYDSKFLNIGFFGFCYYHKGVDRLFLAFKEVLSNIPAEYRNLIRLYIFSTKPKQDNLGYYEQCLNILSQLGINDNVYWISNYLPQNVLLYGLGLLDYIFLPYDDFGSIAASAALTTCVQAENPIVYCSHDSPCFDVDKKYKANVRQLWNKDLVSEILKIFALYRSDEKEKSLPGVWDQYFSDHSWEEVVRRHIELYEG